MWQSITRIEKPDSLITAFGLFGNNSAYFAGGSYLVVEKNSNISTLIDINSLITSEIIQDGDDITIGAKTSIQNIADSLSGIISECARWSCFSKNIRNQRTIGGEVARMRLDSELIILLKTMDIQLDIYNGEKITTSISQWDGKGIITQIHLNKMDIDNTLVERFALLRSAPAFLITAGTFSSSTVSFGIGGKVNQISNYSTPNPPEVSSIDNINGMSSSHLLDDHYGSREYKRALLQTALKRLVEGR